MFCSAFNCWLTIPDTLAILLPCPPPQLVLFDPPLACTTSSQKLDGRMALFSRGTCLFKEKVENVMASGKYKGLYVCVC